MSKLKNFWKRLWVVSSKKWMIGLPVGALLMFVVGILFWGGFHTVLELTNTEEFCVSCHEMSDTVFVEYKKSIHYRNASGVKASCPDCHVPRPWAAKITRKIQASNELWSTYITHDIDTPEKFESKRLELATHVWNTMKETDSRECRNCHAFTTMALAKQSKRARKKHDPKRIAERGETCIDCHQGIAHELPEEDE